MVIHSSSKCRRPDETSFKKKGCHCLHRSNWQNNNQGTVRYMSKTYIDKCHPVEWKCPIIDWVRHFQRVPGGCRFERSFISFETTYFCSQKILHKWYKPRRPNECRAKPSQPVLLAPSLRRTIRYRICFLINKLTLIFVKWNNHIDTSSFRSKSSHQLRTLSFLILSLALCCFPCLARKSA